jgi:hypothetical protein
MDDYRVKLKYRRPRESLGEYLAHLQLPNSDWNTVFNEEQKEYWYKKADLILEFLRHREV